MSRAGIIGMRSAAGDLADIGRVLDDTEWQTPSAAAEWWVRNVISHIGCLLELLQAAVRGEALRQRIEPLNDAMVAERRSWDNTRILENVQKQLEQAIATFIPLQDEPNASVDAPMLDLGTYPLHAIADMFTFDMTTHLRYDIVTLGVPSPSSFPHWTRFAWVRQFPGCLAASQKCRRTSPATSSRATGVAAHRSCRRQHPDQH